MYFFFFFFNIYLKDKIKRSVVLAQVHESFSTNKKWAESILQVRTANKSSKGGFLPNTGYYSGSKGYIFQSVNQQESNSAACNSDSSFLIFYQRTPSFLFTHLKNCIVSIDDLQ